MDNDRSASSAAATTVTGILLRALPYRDADLVLHLFSSERGRVGLLARGARRSKRRFIGATSGFVLARFTVAPGKSQDLGVAESAEVMQQWDGLASDVGAFAHANYVLELVHELLPEGQAEPALLQLLVDYFDELLARGASSSVLRFVEYNVLEITGTPPQLEQCARCGGELGRKAGSLPSGGGALCSACVEMEGPRPGLRSYPPAVRDYLLAIRACPDVTAARDLDAAPELVRLAARELLVGMITHVAPRPLRTLEFIAKMSSALRRNPASKAKP